MSLEKSMSDLQAAVEHLTAAVLATTVEHLTAAALANMATRKLTPAPATDTATAPDTATGKPAGRAGRPAAVAPALAMDTAIALDIVTGKIVNQKPAGRFGRPAAVAPKAEALGATAVWPKVEALGATAEQLTKAIVDAVGSTSKDSVIGLLQEQFQVGRGKDIVDPAVRLLAIEALKAFVEDCEGS